MRKNLLAAQAVTEFSLVTMAVLVLSPEKLRIQYSISNIGQFLLELTNPASLPQQHIMVMELLLMSFLVMVLVISVVLRAGR